GHQEQRKLISDLFTPRAVAALEDDIRRFVTESLDLARGMDRFEVIDTIAGRLPALLTCRLLGWPLAHWRDVKSWSERLMRVDSLLRDPIKLSDATRAVMEMSAVTRPSIEERRGCPATDVLGRWANATLEGCPMSLEQIDS